MQKRLRHAVFGYEATPGGLYPALTSWFMKRHSWSIKPEHILRAPNVLNSLAIAVSLFSNEGDGIIVQPPVFFDFFAVIEENYRRVLRNPLILEDGRYQIDLDGLKS